MSIAPIKQKCEFCKRQFLNVRLRKFCSSKCQNHWRSKHANFSRNKPIPKSLFEVHHQTFHRILKRLGIGCSRCGWNESNCDVHHIRGKRIKNPNSHKNLTYLCPNCHRLFHKGLLKEKDVLSFSQHFGNKWLKFYYG